MEKPLVECELNSAQGYIPNGNPTGKTPRKAAVRLTIFKLEIEGDDVFVL